jgi:4-carboxymuconolactone decarboxylase
MPNTTRIQHSLDEEQVMTEKNKYEAGMLLRRTMWGNAGAEERVNLATSFNRPFEDLVTTYCFGDVWQRPGLDRKTRSMITLTALTALSKPNQLKMHVQGALANGVTIEEIREIILHTSLYSGIPTGVEAMTAAKEVLAKLGLD